MRAASSKRLLFVWLALSAVTALALLVRSDRAGALAPSGVVTFGVAAVSLIKIRLIMRELMEVRHAPPQLGRLTDAWLLVTGAVLLACYFAGLATAAH